MAMAMAIDPFLVACALACIALHFFIGRRLLAKRTAPLPPGPPGVPLLGALPVIGSMPHQSLAKLAKQYGPIMFLKMGSMRAVVASTPDAARTFLKTMDLQFANRPGIVTVPQATFHNQNFTFAEYGNRYKLLRKLLTFHMLGPKALADWYGVRRDEVRRMVAAMHRSSQWGEAVKLPELMVGTNANIMGRVVLSRRVFETTGDAETGEFKEAVTELLTGEGFFNIGEFLPWMAWMDVDGMIKKLRGTLRKVDVLISKMMAEHEATAHERKGRPDFLDMVMANRVDNDGQELTQTHIKALVQDMFSAGTDTSAIITEWAIAEMMNNPSLFRRASAEMDAVIGRDRLLEESDIPKLPFLRALVKEALRLHPSTPLSLPHFTYDACEVEGYHIPAKTRLLVNVWAIARDPDVWEDPLEFNPDRFMPGGKGSKIEPFGNDFEMIPFGAGRRICVGMQLGNTMVQLLLGSLLHAFEMRLADGEVMNMDEKFGIVLPKVVPLKVVLTPRLSPAAYAV